MNFPKLLDNQVALLRADFNTGTVLDENFKQYMTGSKQTVYSVFDNYDDAIGYTKQFVNKLFEFVIYNYNQEVLAYIRPDGR